MKEEKCRTHRYRKQQRRQNSGNRKGRGERIPWVVSNSRKAGYLLRRIKVRAGRKARNTLTDIQKGRGLEYA